MKDISDAFVSTLQNLAAATLAGGGAFLIATVCGIAPFAVTVAVSALVFFKLSLAPAQQGKKR